MATIINGKNPNKPYTVRYQDNGRQRERSFRIKRDARDFVAKFEHDSREHIFVDPKESAIKFREAGKRWVASRTGADSSKRVYRGALVHLDPLIGDKSLYQVANDRYGLTQVLLEALPAKGLGASMVRVSYIVVRAVVNDAIKAGKLSSSRINGIRLPALATKANIVWPAWSQLACIAQELGDMGAAVWLMRGCGLRIGEALAVRWENFRDGQLRIFEQLCPDGQYRPLKHRKPGEYRDVPVPLYVLEALKLNWSTEEKPEGVRFGYVFPDAARQVFSRRFNKARDITGLPADFSPHTLRHVFASVSLSNRVPITDVSTWLGHRDINMTYAIYGHLVPSSWTTAQAVLDSEYETWRNAA